MSPGSGLASIKRLSSPQEYFLLAKIRQTSSDKSGVGFGGRRLATGIGPVEVKPKTRNTMCEHCEPIAELRRLPKLLREKGWSSSDVHSGYESLPGNWVEGSSGPSEKHQGITIYTATAFQVIARENDLKVRVAWPGQFSTTYSCYTAEQVVWWLCKILAVATNEVPIQ